jgi:hypothetical protein
MILRRSLLASSAIVPAALTMGGCASVQSWFTANSGTVDAVLSAAATEANTIATLLGNAVKAMVAAGFPGLTPELQSVVATSVAGIQTTSQALLGSGALATGQSNVQKIATYAAAALAALALLPGLPAGVPAILAGAAVLVPTMGTIVSLVLPKPIVPPSAPAVTVDQAHALAVTTS